MDLNKVIKCVFTKSELKELRQKWRDMRYRCLNPKCKFWRYFGGRGVKICRDWVNDFACFVLDCFFFGGYKPGKSLDLIDPSGDYTPDNIQFVERGKQTRNKRNTLRAPGGISLRDYFERTGALVANLSYNTFARRVSSGWPVEVAIRTPVMDYKRNKKYK